MAFRINTNITALLAQGHLNRTQEAIGKSVERLSSGLRINRGADDAAGLTISEKLRGQIRGLNRAVLNAQDGISLIQTAEGALNENAAILNRMRELAIQSSNDTLTTNDRLEIQKEIDQLVDEVDRVAFTTEFNTKKLLDGTASSIVTTNANGIKGIQVGSTKESSGDYNVELYLSSKGVRQESASNILTVRGEDQLVSRDTRLGDMESFFDNEGNNILRNPVNITIRGNSNTSTITLSSDMTTEEFVTRLKDSITKDSIDGGLEIKGTDVSFNAKTGQIFIKSGRDGSSGDISFSTDENIIKAFGFQITVPSEDPAYRAQAVQQGVADPIKVSTSTTTNRFMNMIPGVDLQFQPPTGAMLEGTKSPVDVIRIGEEDITFSFADTNSELTENNPTHYVNVTLKANSSYSITSIENIINENIRTGTDIVDNASDFTANNGYTNAYNPPDIRASFRGGDLVLTAGAGGTSSKVSLFNVSPSATNILGLQNGVFQGDRGTAARLTGTKDISDGVTISSQLLSVVIQGPDGKQATNIDFAADSNVSATSLVSTINQGMRLANIRAEATIDANGMLSIETIETGDDTAIKISIANGSLTDIGFVKGAIAGGRGGDAATFVGKTSESFKDTGFTFSNATAISITDKFGASSGGIYFPHSGGGVDFTLSRSSIETILNSSDLSSTDVAYEFDTGGKLRFYTRSVGSNSRILVVSNPVGTQAAGTSSTSFLATFGIEGNVAAQGAGETKFMLHVTDRSISLQIGANESQTMDSSIGSFSANALGLVGLDVTSINSAKKALAAIDIAVNRVSSERSKLGSIQNRLGSTINNLTVTSTNLQAAESRIRDVDVAEETVSFTRSQILIQAGTAQLAQAKALPQQALQLIGG